MAAIYFVLILLINYSQAINTGRLICLVCVFSIVVDASTTESDDEYIQKLMEKKTTDPDALTYIEPPVDIITPTIRFLGPSEVHGSEKLLEVQLLKDRQATVVAGKAKYEIQNQDGERPIVKVLDIHVEHNLRMKGIALTILDELSRMYPKHVIQAEFNPDPRVQQDKIAVWHLFARFALRGYAEPEPAETSGESRGSTESTKSSDEPENSFSKSHTRSLMIVEVHLQNGTVIKRAINAGFASAVMPTIRAIRNVRRIIVDPNIEYNSPFLPPSRAMNSLEEERVVDEATLRDPTMGPLVPALKNIDEEYWNLEEIRKMNRPKKRNFKIKDPRYRPSLNGFKRWRENLLRETTPSAPNRRNPNAKFAARKDSKSDQSNGDEWKVLPGF
mmetsp:Transcript_22050/g.32864  ORF Transcript_22050/g.32864 Transcript_22050/m.32864 type:complete len:388 (+) Transcript_22050:42-1205(+)